MILISELIAQENIVRFQYTVAYALIIHVLGKLESIKLKRGVDARCINSTINLPTYDGQTAQSVSVLKHNLSPYHPCAICFMFMVFMIKNTEN